MSATVGGYELEAELGNGATGTVYRARRAGQADQVALKVLAPALATDPAFRARFAREAEIMKQLGDPHCVGVIAYGEDESPWIAMEYVHGATLRAVLDGSGTLTPAQACGVMLGALAGLGHAHERGIVHRDVKPENVLVDARGESKLADFGLVAERSTTGDWRAIEGSPAYMSPEQVRGDPIDQRADLYACGAMLYELLTGYPPYRAETAVAILHAQVDAPLPDTAALPDRVAQVVTRALAKHPDARPATAAAFAAELTDAAERDLGPLWLAGAGLAGLVAAATTVEAVDRAPHRRARRRRIGIGAGIAAVVVVGGALLAGAESSSGRRATTVTTVHTAVSSTTDRTIATTIAPTTIAPTVVTKSLVDPCVVGHWRAASATSYYKNFDSGKTDPETGGAGSTVTVDAAGRWAADNSNEAPFYGTDAGRVLISIYRGRAAGTITARHGLENTTTGTSTVSLAVTIGGQRINDARILPGPAAASIYTCNRTSWVEHNADGTETTWVRA